MPLDVQRTQFTGTYPSLGPGEQIAELIDSVTMGHGLFSLVDAFPFQHPDAPDLSVSIPLSERIWGQGAEATFDDDPREERERPARKIGRASCRERVLFAV